MAQLYFRYSTMNAGKSIDILKTHHNYEEQGKDCLLISFANDTRFGKGVIASRIGIQAPSLLFDEKVDIKKLIIDNLTKNTLCIIVDESQFLTGQQVDALTEIVDELNIPVICYGLLTDFQTKLFPGSKRLLEVSDKQEQLKTVCWVCNKKAIHNLRMKGNKAIFDGNVVEIGDNADKVGDNEEIGYYSVCRKHYKEALSNPDFNIKYKRK